MKNLIEVYTNCYGEYGVEAAIEGASEVGLKNIELAMKPHEGILYVPEKVAVTEKISESQIISLKERLDKKGIVASSGNGGTDISTSEGVNIVKKRLDIASHLGMKNFVIAGLKYEREEKIRANFIEIADYAANFDITIALETHPILTQNAEEILKTMEFLNHKNIRINFDTANIYYHNKNVDCITELEQVAEYVSHVHLKDCRLRYHDWYFPALGEGLIDFRKIFEVLNSVGFYGPFSIEIEGIKGEKQPDLEERQSRVKNSVNYLRRIEVME